MAKYYGVTVDGKHLLKDLNTGQIEIYEDEKDTHKGEREEYSSSIPVFVSRWIDVDKRLPDDGEWVLCTTVSGEILICVRINKYGWETYCETNCGVDSVTHWMPLPDLPQHK